MLAPQVLLLLLASALFTLSALALAKEPAASEKGDGEAKAYNLVIADFGCYFVGDSGRPGA